MIDFEPEIENRRLLQKALRWALANKDHIPSLSALAPELTVAELTELARIWQGVGFGRLIEVSEEGQRSVLFSLNNRALSTSKEIGQRSWMGRLRSVPHSDWVAILALIVSAFSAYFTYLTVRSH